MYKVDHSFQGERAVQIQNIFGHIWSMQRGQDYFAYTLKKDLPFSYFLQKILLSDLRLDTFKLKKYKICLTDKWGVLF